MYSERKTVALTTNGSGAASGYTEPVTGEIRQIQYVKTNFDNGVSITVTSEATGQVVWAGSNVNASVTVAPRIPVVAAEDGAASLYASGGQAVRAPVTVVKDRLLVTVASGGSGKTGTVHLVVG